MCFWAQWRVGMSKNLPNYFEIWKCWTNYLWSRTKVDHIYHVVNMAVSLFPKWYKHVGIFQNRQIQKIVCFVLYCLLYCLFIALGITRAYSFRLEWLTHTECMTTQHGSWAGPAWFKMLLGFGGNQGGGGGERGNFMCLNHNFPLVTLVSHSFA